MVIFSRKEVHLSHYLPHSGIQPSSNSRPFYPKRLYSFRCLALSSWLNIQTSNRLCSKQHYIRGGGNLRLNRKDKSPSSNRIRCNLLASKGCYFYIGRYICHRLDNILCECINHFFLQEKLLIIMFKLNNNNNNTIFTT